MSEQTVNTKIKNRVDTYANWNTANPVLLAGEMGVESDTHKIKIGDGATPWNNLSYIGGSGSSSSVFIGATSSMAGASGLVPAPSTGDNVKCLNGDGTWGNYTNLTPNNTLSPVGNDVKIGDGDVSGCLCLLGVSGDTGIAFEKKDDTTNIAKMQYYNGGIVADKPIIQNSSDSNYYRMIYGNYGAFWRLDDNNLYLMLTNLGDQYGSSNSLRPITVNLSTGVVSINGITFGVD